MLEACSCAAICPCWVGRDPDGGSCDGLIAYHYDRGEIDGVDVTGLTLALAAHTGRLGGPLADLAPLIGEVLGVHDVPIDFRMAEGGGTVRVGDEVSGEMEPLTDLQGRPTKLVDSVFSTIPGSAAYVGTAPSLRARIPAHGIAWAFEGRNAVLGTFRFQA